MVQVFSIDHPWVCRNKAVVINPSAHFGHDLQYFNKVFHFCNKSVDLVDSTIIWNPKTDLESILQIVAIETFDTYLQSLCREVGRGRAEGRMKQGQLNREGGQQSCSALHTPDSTGSWMRLSWACNSSRLDISYSGSVSVQPNRSGRGAQEKRWETWKTTAVDKSRRTQLTEPLVTFPPVPCKRAYQSNCRHSVHQLLMCFSAS